MIGFCTMLHILSSGGRSLDFEIARHLVGLSRHRGRNELTTDSRFNQKLMWEVEKARRLLSGTSHPQTVRVELESRYGSGPNVSNTVSQTLMEQILTVSRTTYRRHTL